MNAYGSRATAAAEAIQVPTTNCRRKETAKNDQNDEDYDTVRTRYLVRNDEERVRSRLPKSSCNCFVFDASLSSFSTARAAVSECGLCEETYVCLCECDYIVSETCVKHNIIFIFASRVLGFSCLRPVRVRVCVGSFFSLSLRFDSFRFVRLFVCMRMERKEWK